MSQKSTTSKYPKNWPINLPYLDAPVYSPTLGPVHRSALRTPSNESRPLPANTPRGPSALVKITPISSPSHPAHGQAGLFAAKDLKPGTFILQYLGEIHASPSLSLPAPASPPHSNIPDAAARPPPAPDPHAHSDYDLSLDREHGLGIDAARRGNEARFINDYRGVAERPNAEFKEVWDERRRERGMGVWVLGEGRSAKGKGKARGIRKGEEVLVSYGRGFWGARKTEEDEEDEEDEEEEEEEEEESVLEN